MRTVSAMSSALWPVTMWSTLNAAAPRNPPWQGDAKSLTVSLSLEALNEQGVVLDSVAFGHFTYWRPGPSPFPL